MTRKRPTLRHLIRDNRGNTLLLVAGMMLPMLAFVGAGIDMSRGYMAKSRLQSACDAGVLAARKTQVGPTLSTAASTIGQKYFKANFGTNSFGTYDVVFNVAEAPGGQLLGSADAKLDTSVMRIFGKQVLTINADCQATMDIADTDVMFVLDTTGSMLETNPSDSENRFDSMKGSVLDFYDELTGKAPAGVKMRFGFVPYAEMVNVGYLLKDEWMVDRWEYQSRTPAGQGTEIGVNTTQTYFTKLDSNMTTSTSTTPATSMESGYVCPAPPVGTFTSNTVTISTVEEPYAGPPAGTKKTTKYQVTYNGDEYYYSLSGSTCTLTHNTYNNHVAEFEHVTVPSENKYYTYDYKPVEYNVAHLGGITSGGSITAPLNWDFSDRVVNWSGCIEERTTKAQTDYSPMPVEALDLDIDLIPTNDPDTQWRPALPGLVFYRNAQAEELNTRNGYWNYNDYWGVWANECPAKAAKLATMTRANVSDYLDTLIARGGTHHDIGMLWGARMISPTGIFGSENGGSQSRHIIFMTDGIIDSGIQRYDSYGYAWLDRRRQVDPSAVPDKAYNDDQIEKRFLAICEATRARGITIWAIAFGVTATPAMETCTGNGKTFQADNAAELTKAFRDIAGSIRKLRLTK